MASIAWWWAIPAVALVVVVAWAAWHTRTRRSPGMHETVAHFAAYQAVLTRVVTGADDDTHPNGIEPRAAARPDVP